MILFCSSLILNALFAILLVLFLVLPMGTYKSASGKWDRVEIRQNVIAAYAPCYMYDKETDEWVETECGFSNCPYTRKGNKFFVTDLDYIISRTTPFSVKFSNQKFICRSKIVWFSISLFGLSAGIIGSIFFGIKVKRAKAAQQQKDD